MYHNVKLASDNELAREINRIKGALVSYGAYLERLQREERYRLFQSIKEVSDDSVSDLPHGADV